ncbi:DUF3499 family protein [Candidatus Poriferisocius sp.]|uniref:DUF3499 family protein n=1 Tax=Candidatus Poriferisocius sp. TaxID=3101276 RepID=UPI003B0259E6
MSETFCARVLCAEPASAALLINARELSAHVVDIREETSITGVPLCGGHADGVVVPSGWTQQDMRSPVVIAEKEPELVLLDDARSDRSEEELILFDDARSDRSEAEEEVAEAAGGEVPPLLKRAFRAAGLD